MDDGDPRGCTAYHHACAGGQLECVKLLLRAGAGTLATSAGAETGWDLAAQVQGKPDGRSREKQRPSMVGNVAYSGPACCTAKWQIGYNPARRPAGRTWWAR